MRHACLPFLTPHCQLSACVWLVCEKCERLFNPENDRAYP